MSTALTHTMRRQGGPQRLDIGGPVSMGLLVVLGLACAAFLALIRNPFDGNLALAEVRIVTGAAYEVRLPAGFGLARVMVREGQDVVAGDVIAVLDTAAIDAQTAALKVEADTIEKKLDTVRAEAKGFSDQIDKRLLTRVSVGELRQELGNLEREAAEILSHIVKAERQLTQQDIRAPVSGRIASAVDAETVKASTSDALLARIVPRTGRLLVETRISPELAHGWRVGQEVRVWLNGLSWLKGRPSRAHLTWMAADPTSDEGGAVGLVTARIEIDADGSALAAALTGLPGLGRGLVLRDGQRTLLQQILDPIRRSFNRSSRA